MRDRVIFLLRDRQPEAAGGRIRFTSSILTPYLLRAKSVEELLTSLYLKGNSTVDFEDTQAAKLGHDETGLSENTNTRLKSGWT